MDLLIIMGCGFSNQPFLVCKLYAETEKREGMEGGGILQGNNAFFKKKKKKMYPTSDNNNEHRQSIVRCDHVES